MPQKFVLIAVVMVVPLIWVVIAYIGVQNNGVAFASKEQIGLQYLRPTTRLLSDIVAARTVSMQAAKHTTGPAAVIAATDAVNAAIGAVNAADPQAQQLGLSDQWANVRSRVRAVISTPARSTEGALASYTGAAAAIENLVGRRRRPSLTPGTTPT